MTANSSLPGPCTGCPGNRLARLSPVVGLGKKGGVASLVALFVPGVLFAAGLVWLAAGDGRFGWLRDVWHLPWQLWVVAVCGVAATVGGVGDWLFHRQPERRCLISRGERRIELLALGAGGVPLFVLMALASLSAQPLNFLLPVVVLVLGITALICYDEFIYHRKRCGRLETALHRLLVFGNGLAWLAWADWVFVRGGVSHA